MKVLFVLAGLLACNNIAAQQNDFKWLVGTWKIEGKDIFEVWKAQGSRDFEGRSFLVKGTDTVVTETISLKFFNASFHYIPDVAGDQPPIDFRITSSDSHSFVAENPQHDFPKVIRYRYVIKDHTDFIEAVIEGNGKIIPYTFRKLK